ncbi:MAG: UDP-N-acetylmuramoyl-L-alanine--D-glutamate ligase [Balneolaceae bacterium]
MYDLKGKHITVVGAARSGVAVASLLKRQGAKPFVTDIAPVTGERRERLEREKILFEEGGHTDLALDGEFAVVSPGVPDTNPVVHSFISSGRSLYSELEVASWFCRSPIVAVTGSNGKTTVTSWLEQMWRVDGRKPLTAGNIGTALSDCVEETSPDRTAILEVSSFQLDHIDRFKPNIAILLNVTPDHLDRYENSFEKYAASKFRISERQGPEDIVIYNLDDPVVSEWAANESGRADGPKFYAFSALGVVPTGLGVREGQLEFHLKQTEEPFMEVGKVGLPGRHNLSNGLATALAARLSEIRDESIRESLRTFEGVGHRLEPVRKVRGVKYFNDSKATNVNAVWYALDSFNVPVVLILGGRDKGNDYRLLADLIREKVHTIVSVGEAKGAIREQLSDVVPELLEADSLESAVQMSAQIAKRGEVVLLSPACASFDMFDSYEHRGEVFRHAVMEL